MMIRRARFDAHNRMERAIYTLGYTYRPQSEHFRGRRNGEGAKRWLRRRPEINQIIIISANFFRTINFKILLLVDPMEIQSLQKGPT